MSATFIPRLRPLRWNFSRRKGLCIPLWLTPRHASGPSMAITVRAIPQFTGAAMFARRCRNRKEIRRLQHNDSTDSNTSKKSPEVSSTIPYLGHGVMVGQVASSERTYSSEDVDHFASCVLDYNPLHTAMDWDAAVKDIPFWNIHRQNGLIQFDDNLERDGLTTKPIVHGMLVSSIFSSIFASLSPGCIYMNQTLSFENPVYVNDTVIGRIEIEKIRKWRKGGVVVQCKTQAAILQSDETSGSNTPHGGDGIASNFSRSLAMLAVRGTANVWLPSGYAGDLDR